MADQSPSQPPGWYYAQGDPAGTHRYWDGELWQGDPVNRPMGRAGADYASWGTRVGATLLDLLLICVPAAGVALVSWLLSNVSETLGTIAAVVLGLPVLLLFLYVTLWLPGITGQSPGRRLMGYEIVSEQSGEYIGGGKFIGRQIVGGILDNFCYIDSLWPLFDKKNQRLADKIVSSVAVNKPKGKLFPIFPSGKPF